MSVFPHVGDFSSIEPLEALTSLACLPADLMPPGVLVYTLIGGYTAHGCVYFR